MIYVKRFNTCFLRIPKAGSQSLQLFVENNIVDKTSDIIARPILQSFESEYRDNKLEKISLNTNVEFSTAHVTAEFTIDNGITDFDTKFIGVIRNPYEKLISNYIYRLRRQQFKMPENSEKLILQFRESIKDGTLSIETGSHHLIKQIDFFRYRNEMLPNVNVWILDNLKYDLNNYCEQNNIHIKYPLSHINKSHGDKQRLIGVFYTPELKKKVYDVYQEDFELYNRIKKDAKNNDIL